MRQGLKTYQKVFYGAGDIMGTMAFTFTATFLLFYFTDVMEISAALAGLTIFLGNFWDAITDPYAGYISDKTRSKLGRRRPYFLYMALPIGITFILIFAVPASLAMVWKFAFCTIAYLAFMTATTFYMVPYLAYGMEIERSYDGRTSVTAWRMLFSIAFGLVALVVPPMIWDSAPKASQGYFIAALIFAIPIALSPLFPFLIGKEPELSQPHKSRFFEDFKKALKSSHFVKGIFIYVCTWVGINAVQALLLYYFKYVVNLYDEFSILAGILFGVAILALPFWVFLSKKLDKRKAYIIGAVSFAVMLITLLFPASFVREFRWAIVVMLGIGISSLHVMPTAILPEAIEAATSGKSGEGAHYGILTFIYKIANGVALFIIPLVLQLSGFISSKENEFKIQPQSAIDMIHILIAAVPVALLIIGIIIASRFKISRHGLVDEKLSADSEKGAQ